MTESETILVTGATGTVGAQVVQVLATAGAPTVAAVRDAASVMHGASSRILDFHRPETFPAALGGIGRLFLMRPPALSDVKRYLRPFLSAAQTAGVRQVVSCR